MRRQITTYRYARKYETLIQHSAVEFLNENRIPYLHVTYEGMIVQPTETIDRLNRYLDINLGLADLQAVYHKPLYKNPRSSWGKHLKAMLIYAKNYPERLDIAG